MRKLQNDILDSVERYKSILAIPKKSESLIHDLETVLLLVKGSRKIHDDQLTMKIMEVFKVSFNTARNVRPTLERANLLMKNKNKVIKLTNMAENYFTNKETGYLTKGFIYNYFGFLEILYLIQKNGPSFREELFFEWKSLYEKEFGNRLARTNTTQISRIYIYLIGFNLIEIHHKKMRINKEVLLGLDNIEYW